MAYYSNGEIFKKCYSNKCFKIFIRIIHEHSLKRKNLGLSWKLAIAPLLKSLFLSCHRQPLLTESCNIYFIFPKRVFVLLYCLSFNFRRYLLISFIHVCPPHMCTLPFTPPSLGIFYVIILIILDLIFILWHFKHDSRAQPYSKLWLFFFPVQAFCFYVGNKFFFLFKFLFITISAFTKFAKRFCFLHFIVSISLKCLSHYFLPL